MTDWYPIEVRFTGRCVQCGLEIQKGDTALYLPNLGIKHEECPTEPNNPQPDQTELVILE